MVLLTATHGGTRRYYEASERERDERYLSAIIRARLVKKEDLTACRDATKSPQTREEAEEFLQSKRNTNRKPED